MAGAVTVVAGAPCHGQAIVLMGKSVDGQSIESGGTCRYSWRVPEQAQAGRYTVEARFRFPGYQDPVTKTAEVQVAPPLLHTRSGLHQPGLPLEAWTPPDGGSTRARSGRTGRSASRGGA